MKRTFVAIKARTDPDFIKLYDSIRKELQQEKIRWVAPDNLHITLRFLGNTDEEALERLSTVLSSTANANFIFSAAVKSAGVFRNIHTPRVIWLGTENTDAFKKLKETLDNYLERAGIPPADSEFRPHLTLGRLNHIKNKELLKDVVKKYEDFVFCSLEVNRIIFYESILGKGQPQYRIISEHPLCPGEM